MWNFRVVKKGDDFAVYYAYYGTDGELNALSQSEVSPTAEDVESLRQTLGLMMEACEKPVVEYSDEISAPIKK